MKANYRARDPAALTEALCLYTPPERLRELAMCEDVAVRSAVASHRFTRGDVLKSMMQDDALCVRVSLAKNPRLPKAARRVLLRDDNVLFTFQCVLVDLYEHPERHYDWNFPIFGVARAYLRGAFRRLERPFPPDIAERIRNRGRALSWKKGVYAMKSSAPYAEAVELAGDPGAHPEVLRALAQCSLCAVREAVAGNESTPGFVLAALSWEAAEASVRCRVAGNRSTPVEYLRAMIYDPDDSVRRQADDTLQELRRAGCLEDTEAGYPQKK